MSDESVFRNAESSHWLIRGFILIRNFFSHE